MARTARIVVPGCPHHLTQRGNQRRQVFFAAADYRRYLALLGELAGRYGVRVQGYCLMPNHVHLIPVPATADALGRAIGQLNQRYSQLLNLREGLTGHRWHNRFFSCPLDDTYFLRALRYVERNAARAPLVEHPWDYSWSSARAHDTGDDPTGLLDLPGWAETWPGDSWREFLALPEAPGEAETFRLATSIGRPLGTDAFLDRLEQHTSRRLRPLPVGRPKKEHEKEKSSHEE